jgi:hypothetical protein
MHWPSFMTLVTLRLPAIPGRVFDSWITVKGARVGLKVQIHPPARILYLNEPASDWCMCASHMP